MSEITPPEIDPIKQQKKRTLRQNSAMHLFFTHLADELNAAGLDQRVVLKPEIAIPWDDKAVKEKLFKPILKVYKGKESTTLMTTTEIDEVIQILTRHLGESLGFVVPEFPSIESLIAKQNQWRKPSERKQIDDTKN